MLNKFLSGRCKSIKFDAQSQIIYYIRLHLMQVFNFV